MMWSVLTLVGADQKGIVAAVSRALFEAGCQLAEASMMRLGGNFAVMLRVAHEQQLDLQQVLSQVCQEMNLHLHLDQDIELSSQPIEPDVHISVYGADRLGIVAQVTGALAEAGLNIIDLETAVAGAPERPIYVMSLEGHASQGMEALQQAIAGLDHNIDISLTPIDTMRG
ncbi:MAG: glycine cleavage system protein R [Gammaproteobacteria bacterium]